MATRKKPAPPVIGAPEISPEDGIKLLNQQIERAELLLAARPIAQDAISSWDLLTKNFLSKAFGNFSPNVSAVVDIGKYGGFPMNASPEWWENHNAKTLNSKVSRLRGLVELLQTEIGLNSGTSGLSEELAEPAVSPHLSRECFWCMVITMGCYTRRRVISKS